MATVLKRRITVQPDVCMRFPGVGWAGFQHAKALVGEEPVRITYANGDLLLMSPGPSHESFVVVFEDLVRAVARAFRIRTRTLRSMLWERAEADAGKMPDTSFYVASVAQIGNRIPKMAFDPSSTIVITT